MKRTFITLLSVCALVCAMTVHAATVNVAPGTGTIAAAVKNAGAGDVLVLATGEYSESSVKPTVALTIQAAEGAKPVIKMSSRFEVKADFTLQGVVISSTAEAVRLVPGSSAYNVTIRNCELSGCPNYYIRAYNTDQSAPYINKLTVDNCIFRMGGTAINTARAIAASAVPKQLKNMEVKNSTFDGGAYGTGRIIYIHSGVEETILPVEGSIDVDHCTFYNSADTRGVYLANVDGCHATNCIFMNSEERENTNSFAVYGANSYVHNCLAFNAPVKVGSDGSQANCLVRNPYFVDAANGNFQLYKNSPAINAGTDGSNLGDPRWGVSSQSYDNGNDPYVPYKQPYSMAPTTNSVKVLWQMNDETEATEALVYYGTDPNNLNQQVQTNSGWNVADEGYVHVVTLTGLQPNTRYYFTVGANATRRFDKVCSTKTAPEQGTAYRIFSISDIHGNARNNWINQQDFICGLNCDIALMNGDFVSSKGNDRNWNNYYFTPGQKFLSQVPCMSSPGNHETGDPRGYRWSSFYDYFHQFSHEGEPEDEVTDPRGESYFHFVYGNADVIILNLNFDESSPAFEVGSKQYKWLDETLAACTRPWIIVCHHVGIYTTGYHGQWSEEPKRCAPLLEKYAAQGKHIISLSGDDHSFEHLYKDGVHYVRPGCGRDANYDQQKQLIDYKYSLFYKKVSCFSTLDMAADASHIYLTAYDSVGTPFYNYDFLLEGNVINPSVNFTSPTTEVNVEDSILLRWSAYDPAGDATLSFYYSQTANAASADGMKPIATGLPGNTEKYMWHTRDVFPKGKYYVYAVISSQGKNFMGGNTVAVNLLDDTTPPPAPSELKGYIQDGKYLLTWNNPTHLVKLDNLLTDFSDGMSKMQQDADGSALMTMSVVDGALKCDYSINEAWATASADFVFDAATDMHQTPILTFRLKGNGTYTDMRLVCKNMSGGHEDWWYTESINLSNSAWQEITIDMRSLLAFEWYANTDDKNKMEGVIRISFGVSTENPVSGTFYIDDLRLSGEIYPAPDYAQTVIVRKDNAFPASPTDGTEIYRGTAETCMDPSAVVGQVYYYAAFAADDRNNWSAPDAGAQWKSENVTEQGVENIQAEDSRPQKILRNGQLFIRHGANIYTVLGQKK